MFNNNNSNNNKPNSLFGNNSSTNSGGSIFGNNNNSTSLFGNNNSNQNNNNNTNSLFGNSNNQNTSLFGNNNNSNNQGISLFGNNNNSNSSGGLFGNNNNNNDNKQTNTLFNNNNNNGSLFGNNVNNNQGNSIFGNNNASTGGLFGNNNNATNQGISLFGNNNNNNNQNQGLFNNNATSGNNNMNNPANNNGFNNVTPYEDVTLNDIMNPLEYLSSSRSLKLSPQDEILSNSIMEAIEKQKSVNQFLEDLDKKYKKEENINDNNDILENYGTYLGNTTNYNYNKYENEIPSIYKSSSTRFRSSNNKWINSDMNSSTYNESNNNRIYNKEDLNNSMTRISNIYEEYERQKNKYENSHNKSFYNKSTNYNQFKSTFMNNEQGKEKDINSNIKLNPSNSNIQISSILLANSNPYLNSQSTFIGRNNAIFHQNLSDINRLSSIELNSNLNDLGKEYISDNDENDDNNEILVMNNENESDSNTMDLIIKYRLPDAKDNNMRMLKIENVNQLIKISTLRSEIKSRILNELKLKDLESNYSIQKISLLIPGGFLLDNKSLQDYDLAAFDFTIQAYITYSNTIKSKKSKKIVNGNEIDNNEHINIKDNELVPIELVPKLTKEGYKCIPSIMELSRKTANELRNVTGFKIYNKYGEVVFKEPVNLLGLNLDNQITIEKNLIDTGDKLNYWSKFKLYNFKVEENGINKYKVNLEKSGGNLLDYSNNEISWEYKKK